MKFPEDVKQQLVRRFHNKHRQWLDTTAQLDNWPLEISLGVPTEQTALQQFDRIKYWASSWQKWQGSAELVWCERRWPTMGNQRLPHKIIFDNANDIASFIGEGERWQLAKSRYNNLIARWPSLTQQLPTYFNMLADYTDIDFQRLIDMLNWIICNPQSNLYPRQIPLAGLDSKWLEQRTGIITKLVSAIQGDSNKDLDFYQRCGLKPLPKLMRLRVLDPELRATLGGIEDISASSEEFARLPIKPQYVFVVENLQSGLAFNDLPSAVLIMRLGYAVNVLSEIPWLAQAKCFYMGDIDTHGFAILNRARKHLPQLQSLLMDETTLMNYRELWAEEDSQTFSDLQHLNDDEQKIYHALKTNKWGHKIRLEQERINWQTVWQTILQTLNECQ